jgi:glycosyltransferase involved in cell wall biosynthesis
MKKDLLFVMNNLVCGGAEKALVSLLQSLDYSKYNVDLYLFKKEGLFLSQVPGAVTILAAPKNYPYFDMSLKRAIIENLKRGNLKVVFYRIIVGLINKTEKGNAVREQKVWKYLRHVLPHLKKEYDVAIGFLEKTPNYFCVDNVTSKLKIGYVMNDYEKLKMNKEIDNHYFSKLDYVVQDSEESNATMAKVFPQFKDKLVVVKSIMSPVTIRKLANEKVVDFPSGFTIVSVGRLTYQKGYDLAMEAMKIFSEKGHSFNWVVLGEGEDKLKLQQLVADYNLESKTTFLGIKENHYPYLKQADIFLHTARFEGYGIVVQEAKILNKPILLTDFNTSKTHITNGVNGLIVPMDPKSIALGLERLFLDANLRQQFSMALSEQDYGTEKEIESFYSLIETV